VIDRRAKQGSGNYDTFTLDKYPTYTAKEGDHSIRVLPPLCESLEHYAMHVWLHSSVGADNQTYLCLKEGLNQPCPLCEERRRLEREGASKDEIAQFKPYKRAMMWIINRKKPDLGPLLWACPWTLERDLAGLAVDKQTGDILCIDHWDAGYDITFSREGSTQTNTKYGSIAVARRSTPLSDDPAQQDAWLEFVQNNPLPDTLNFYSYAHVLAKFTGESDSSVEEAAAIVQTRSDIRARRPGEAPVEEPVADDSQELPPEEEALPFTEGSELNGIEDEVIDDPDAPLDEAGLPPEEPPEEALPVPVRRAPAGPVAQRPAVSVRPTAAPTRPAVSGQPRPSSPPSTAASAPQRPTTVGVRSAGATPTGRPSISQQVSSGIRAPLH